METHLIFSICFIIISIIFLSIGFNESKKDNTILYEKINAKLNNVNITTSIQQRKAAKVGTVVIYTNKTVYNVNVEYIYQVNGMVYFKKYTYITLDDGYIANSYIYKIKKEKPSITLYYFKTNPSINVTNIQKNNAFIFYILSFMFALASFIAFLNLYQPVIITETETKTETTIYLE